nr:transposon Ty3-G Gag-Pol polyprotein [Tanacetum cinerariifolium]
MIGYAEETENENPTTDALDMQADEVQGEISFHAISGAILPQTLRLPGRIQNKDVVVLLDGGSTHNFVDQELVNHLGLQVDPTVNFSVVVANREKLACTGRVQNLSLIVQGCVISTDFFVLPVAACLIVLGSHHKLQGLKASKLSALKSHELMGICDAALLLQIVPVLPQFQPELSPSLSIQKVLTDFCKVFQEPSGLPSPRFHDHSIPLLPGSKPMCSRPYRQPYFQKNAIEKQIFSKLDLRSGYHQIRVREDDIHKTAFRTHEGHYGFLVMPFGLTNALTTFQWLMNDLFYVNSFVFFDDILIYSPSMESHLQHLHITLKLLEDQRLFTKASKCCFGVPEVNYLGHVISANGVAVENSKVLAVLSWPTPKSAKGVRGFLGLAGYYRKFIKDFGSIAAILHRLVGKAPFSWDSAAKTSFQALKQSLTTTPTLGLPNWSLPFTIECDASGVGIEAVLTQNGHPLAYYSAPLKGTMLTWSTYEKEMLALVKSVWKGRHYLLGRLFVVKTDHMSLKYLLEQRLTTPAQARWLPKLLGYDYRIDVQEVDEYLQDRDSLLKHLRKNLLNAQDHMKANANRHRRDLEFKEAQVSKLKEVPGPLEIPSDPQPEKILEEWVITKGRYRPKTEVLIKWVGQPLGEATWENNWRFFKTYPAFRVEDNAGLSGVDCYVALDPTHAHRISHTEGV